jgi:hypothetical protein
VEEKLMEFQTLVAALLARCPHGPHPGRGETNWREGGVPLASSELFAQFYISQNAPRAGDMDRMMGIGNPTPKQTSRLVRSPNRSPPRRNLEPVLLGDQREESLSGLVNEAEEMAETSTQPDEEARPEGEPEGNLEGHPDGEQEGERGA